MKYRLFFAWQSQNKAAHSYIRKQLQTAQQELETDGFSIDLIFSPTQDESGSPDIKMSILEQIKMCDVFVGDLSFIDPNKKITNANVLYESGIADAFLGEERVILLCDENTIIEDIAFDINHKRVSKFNTKKPKSDLKYWIAAALEEADRQKYVKTYATDQYAEDLLIMINYFMKLSFYNNELPDDLSFPNADTIQNNIKNFKYPLFFLNVDFGDVISALEEKIMRLNQFSHKRIVWNIINIISKLKEYHNFCYQARFSLIQILDNEQAQYNVYDSNNFFLKSVERYSPSAKTVLYLENSEIIIGNDTTLVIDKRINKENDKYYRRKIIPFQNNEKAQLAIASVLARINPESVKIFSQLISNIFISIHEYLDYSDLKLKYDEGIKTITIID